MRTFLITSAAALSVNGSSRLTPRFTPTFVGEIWAADIAILPESQQGNPFLFVMMEYLTRWTVAVALPITDSETLATVLLFEVVFKFGTPRRLITDNGSNLTSDIMQTLAKLLQMRHSHTSVEHPQSDGLVERMNRTIKTALAA